MCVSILWWLAAARLFYRVAAERSCSAVCVYLGYQYFGLGVLRGVFGVRYAVSILVTVMQLSGHEIT